MNTLLSIVLIPLSFLASCLAFAQVNCITYTGGQISCTGADGYQAEGRKHFGGMESWHDNRGNTATVRQHSFGVTSIDTTPRYTGINGSGHSVRPTVVERSLNSSYESTPRRITPPDASYFQMYGLPQPTAYSAKEMEQFEAAHRAGAAEHAAWLKNYEEVIVPNAERGISEYVARQAKQLADRAESDRIQEHRQALARAAYAKQMERDKADIKRQQAETSAKRAVLEARLDRLVTEELRAKQ